MRDNSKPTGHCTGASNQFRDAPRPLVVSKRDVVVDEPSYWPSLVDHGVPSMGSDPSFPVYRDVADPRFGGQWQRNDRRQQPPSMRRLHHGNNCKENRLSSTVKSTFIYFPPGGMSPSPRPSTQPTSEQRVGNPNNHAIIKKRRRSSVGLGGRPNRRLRRRRQRRQQVCRAGPTSIAESATSIIGIEDGTTATRWPACTGRVPRPRPRPMCTSRRARPPARHRWACSPRTAAGSFMVRLRHRRGRGVRHLRCQPAVYRARLSDLQPGQRQHQS